MDSKAEIKWDYRGDIREYFNESKLCDSFIEDLVYESGMVKGSFIFNSRMTMRMRGPKKIILRNSQLKGKSNLKVI